MNGQCFNREGVFSRAATATLMVALGGLFGNVAAGIAGAASMGEGNSTVVRYRPASLGTERGSKALYRRLVTAAEQVCPAPSGTRLVPAAVQTCRDQAISRAVEQIGSPALAALHAGRVKSG
jgi:UrcA family protein